MGRNKRLEQLECKDIWTDSKKRKLLTIIHSLHMEKNHTPAQREDEGLNTELMNSGIEGS